MRRAAGLMAVLAALAGALLFWQPESLKQRLAAEASKALSRRTPYAFTIARISGNPLTGFLFRDLRVRTRADGVEVFHARRLSVKLRLWPLVSRRLLEIERMTLDLGGGNAEIRGRWALAAAPAGTFQIAFRNVALHTVGASSGWPAPLRLAWTGVSTIAVHDKAWEVDLRGMLSGAPLQIHMTRNGAGWIQANGLWREVRLGGVWVDPGVGDGHLTAAFRVSGHIPALTGTLSLRARDNAGPAGPRWLDAHARLAKGTGPFRLDMGWGASRGEAQGILRLPARRIEASGRLAPIQWQQMSVRSVTWRLEASARRVRASLLAEQATWGAGRASAADLRSGFLACEGESPVWTCESRLRFHNGAFLEAAGPVRRRGREWRVRWDRASGALATGGVWHARPGGRIVHQANDHTRLEGLFLVNGAQRLEIPRARLERGQGSAQIRIVQWDPSPWMRWAASDIAVEGVVNANLTVHGRYADPVIEGFLRGRLARVAIPSADWAVQDLDIDIRSRDGILAIHRFRGRVKNGWLTLSGQSRLPALNFALDAQELSVTTRTRTRGTGNLHLRLTGSVDQPILKGELALKEGTYTPEPTVKKKEDRRHGESPRDADRRRPGDAASPHSLWTRTTVDVRAHWPRNVWFRDGLTGIETRADLRAQKSAGTSPLLLTGDITSIRGTYSYFGRDFTIDSGRVQFVGTPDNNPLIHIQASYRRDPTIVYLDVTGTARQVNLKLRSNPPLSDQDIVSVVVFGQPLSQLRARSGGPSTNQQALQAAGSVLGSYISKGLRQTGLEELNFDVLNIEPTQEGSQLTVGRYLTRRLFVSYGQMIRGSAHKSLTADYFLTDKWTLQGATSSATGNYMDLLFRYPLNKQGSAPDNPPIPDSPFRNSLNPPALFPALGVPVR